MFYFLVHIPKAQASSRERIETSDGLCSNLPLQGASLSGFLFTLFILIYKFKFLHSIEVH